VFTVPLAVKVGVVPTTALLLLSINVMVTAEVATPSATTGLVPTMLEFATEALSAVNVTVPSAFTNGVAIDNVLISAFVELRVQVASPEAFVTEHAEAVLFVPLAVNVGVWPGTGLLLASRNVTVTVDVALPLATTGPVPVMFELTATGVPAVKVTEPSVFATGVTMARVFTPETVELKVQVATLVAFVTEHADSVLPVPVAENVGVSPAIGLLNWSKIVMVTVEVAAPSATTGPVPVMVEVATAGAPAVKVTVPSAFTTGVAIDNVLISALVETRVHVATPLASVALQLPGVAPVPLAVKVGVVPTTALSLLSFKVTVTVEVATPSATTGPVPVMLEFAMEAASAVKVTVPSAFTNGVAIESVLISALVELKVQVASPEALVTEHAEAVLLVPEAVKVGVWPGTGLLLASRKVTVTVEVALPLAITGLVPVMFEFTATGVPGLKVTVPSVFATGVTIARVFTPEAVELKVHVATPLALVTEHADRALPAPVAEKVGVSPAIGLLN
jgi:hypothetical protein